MSYIERRWRRRKTSGRGGGVTGDEEWRDNDEREEEVRIERKDCRLEWREMNEETVFHREMLIKKQLL